MAELTNGLETIEIGAVAWREICNSNFTKIDPYQHKNLWVILEKDTVDLAAQQYASVYIPKAIKIIGAHACVGVAGSGSEMLIDIHNDGDSIFSNRLTVAASATTDDDNAAIDETFEDVPDGGVLTFHVDQTHTTPAKGLSITLEYEPQ